MLSVRPPVAAALLFGLAAPLLAAGERIALLSGEVYLKAKLERITPAEVRFLDSKGKERAAKLEDLVSITRPGEVKPLPEPRPHHVLVLLRDGDRIHGALLPGKEEMIDISSPHAGPFSFHVDDIAEIRFEAAWRAIREKPPAPTGEQDFDLFTYRNLDRLEGTFLLVTARTIRAHTRVSDVQEIGFAKLLAIRFADAPPPEPVKGATQELRLVDGSRLTARSLTTREKSLSVVTIRNEKLEIELEDVLSVHQKGGRFVYLSDVPAVERKIVPWIGESYAWDRPRLDRSFLDRPIRAGGESWQKGIGVISGTSLTYRLDGTLRTFRSRIALDDAAGEEGDVVFEVLVDGKSRYRSGTIRKGKPGETPARIPPIDLAGAKSLTLRVLYVDDFVMDFADWIEPMLVR